MLDGIHPQLCQVYVLHVMWDIPNLFQVSHHVTSVRRERTRILLVRQSAIHVMLDGMLHQQDQVYVLHVMWDIPNLFQVNLHVTSVRQEHTRILQVRHSAFRVMRDGMLLYLDNHCVKFVKWDIPNPFQVNLHVRSVRQGHTRIPLVRQSAFHVMLDGMLHQ